MCKERSNEPTVNPRTVNTTIQAIHRRIVEQIPSEEAQLQRIWSIANSGTLPVIAVRHNPPNQGDSVHMSQEGTSPNTSFTYPNTIVGRQPHQNCPCNLQPNVVPKKRSRFIMFTARTILIISFILVIAKLVSNFVVSADALSTDRPSAVAISTDKPATATNYYTPALKKPATATNYYTPALKEPVQDSQCADRAKRQLPPLEQGNQLIDSIFQIPINTLNAVGSFIKNARPFVRRTRERIQQYYTQQYPTITSQQQLQQQLQQQHFYNSKPTSEEESMYGHSDRPFIMFFSSKKRKLQKQRDEFEKIESHLHRHEYIDDY